MPSRNLPLSALHVNVNPDLTPRGFNPKDFNANFNEPWDNWMEWGSNTLEQDSPIGYSNASLIDTWAHGSEENMMPRSYSADIQCPFDASPFEFDQSPHGSAIDFMNTHTPHPANFQSEQDRPNTFRRFSSLTPEEEKRLEDIAMPYHLQALLQTPAESSSSPPESPIAATAPLAPEAQTRKSRKQKQTSPQSTSPSTIRQSRQSGHNAIEKRYRTNLNERIDCLRQGIPSLNRTSSSDSTSGDEIVGDNRWDGQLKYGKAAVLARALEYIKHLETTTQRLSGEVKALKVRMGGAEMGGSVDEGAAEDGLKLLTGDTLESIQAEFQHIGFRTNTCPGRTQSKDRSKASK
ncbi:putative transcription factor [Lachnellula occidentalis]|uniref:Putative transcription factor n=1 Tax=Lachnellula occidentalis TaxID=215460 RepID=A0A8H8UGZ3_9HELO|nr:putative transcription factor [Lachnellula occidentalis]